MINVFILNSNYINEYQCFYDYKYYNQKNKTLEYIADFFEIEQLFDNENTNENIKDNNLEYDVISPSYWKYRNNNYISENDIVDNKGVVIKREFEVKIAPFIRKINSEASLEARNLAKKLCVKLEEGHTIVKPHVRTYKKRIDS